jgi:hypothetical protein
VELVLLGNGAVKCLRNNGVAAFSVRGRRRENASIRVRVVHSLVVVDQKSGSS